MATAVLVKNPFRPLNEAPSYSIPVGQTIRGWLESHFPGFKEFDKPTVCFYNGKPCLRGDWHSIKPVDSDVVLFVPHPGTPVQLLYFAIAAIISAAVTIALTPKLTQPNTGPGAEADPVYTLKGQRNQVRLGMPIETVYGAPRIWPSYASQPYNQYRDNQQWLYQLFCLGNGQFDISEMRFEDTPIADFDDVETQIVAPGGTVTLFPVNVVTAPEVNGIELLGPNEAGLDGTNITISEGDGDVGIDPETVPAASIAGPFTVNGAGTEANTIECDIVFPRGLYTQNDAGALQSQSVTVLFEMRLIDNSGNPLGAWETMESVTKNLATITPQRFTIVRVVPFGRYQVRASRTTNKNEEARSGNTVQWESLRAFLNTEQNFGDVTLIAVKARATNNLNDNTASRFNVLGTRKLPIYDANTETWSAPTATRSIVWAFCDAVRASYGGRMADTFLNLSSLVALDAGYTSRGEYFDWVFDQRATLWEVLRLIAQCGQAVPMLVGSQITMIRDESKTIPIAIFGPDNMVKGSFSWELKLWEENPYDGLRVTYIDPVTWKEETVLCLLDGETGDYPEDVTLAGCTGRDHAYAWGMHRRRTKRYVRENIVFTTGLEGHIPSYGDLIAVAHDIPSWGVSGLISAETRQLNHPSPGFTTYVLTLTEGHGMTEPVSPGVYQILVRSREGSTLGPYPIQAIVGATQVVIALQDSLNLWQTFVYDGSELPPFYQIGPAASGVTKLCKVVNLTPQQEDTVQITSVNYDSRVYTGATTTDPLPEASTPPRTPALPVVRGLIVTRAPGTLTDVIASWYAARGARYYVVQMSVDGTNWAVVNDSFQGTSIQFTVPDGYLYVRVCAVNTGQGPWRYWTGFAPKEDIPVEVGVPGVLPDAVSNVAITAGFGMLWVGWTNPTNTPLKELHVYIADSTVKPGAPTQVLAPTQTFLSLAGLADNVTKYFWIQAVNMEGDEGPAQAGAPTSGTTTNGITLSHLIPGGLQPVEIVTSLPATANYQGRIVFLTADDTGTVPTSAKDKLYRWTSPSVTTGKTYWTAAVPTVDLTGKIENGQIADNAILAAQLADNAVEMAKLKDGAVTNAKILAGAVDALKIADGAVEAAKIAAGAVLESKIATNAITVTKIADNAIEAGKIAMGAVGSTHIAALAVNGDKIAANAISAAKIADGAIEAGKIAAGAVESTKLAMGAVTADALAANAVTTAKIAAGAVTTASLATAAVTADVLALGAVTETKIGENAITAGKIAANAVTAGTIAAGAVSAGTIAAGAITATDIAAGAITAGKIAANAVTASEIAAGAITAGKIAAESISAVELQAGSVVAGKIAASAVTATEIAAGAITAGKIAAGAVTATEIAAGAITTEKLAAGAVTATEIAAGAITTAKLAAGAVTATEIAAGAITAGKIATLSITAGDIAAGAITAGKIAALSITAGDIAAGAITTEKITAGSVTALTIATGAITAEKISSNAVTADKINAGSITSDKIFAGAVTADAIAANAVTTAKIFAGAVEADKIAANAVTSDKITANAITSGKIAAGAITATAIGTNEIIANTANIKDGVITDAKIGTLSASKITAGTVAVQISLTSPNIVGNGIYINSAIGMRYVSDAGVFTITGGSNNGAAYGSQIDLAGNSLVGGNAGVLVLAAGNVSTGQVLIRTQDTLRMSVAYNGDVVVQQNLSALSLTATSAKRYKRAIRTLSGALATVGKLRGVSFEWNRKGAKRGRDIGLIAEEVQKVVPCLVHKKAGRVESLDYDKFAALFVNAIQELNAKVDALN